MRRSKLAPAAVGAAALLALAPAGALALGGANAHPHRFTPPPPKHGCRISLSVEPRQITAGEPIAVFGRLVCQSGVNVSNQTVTVYQHSAGTPNFTVAGTATTDSNGSYGMTPAAFQTNTVFYVTAAGVQSPHRAVSVKARVTIAGPPDGSQLFTGGGHAPTRASNRVTFTGTVSPGDAGAAVILQREAAIAGEDWHRIGVGVVSASGTYTIVHTFVVPGEANIRVVVRPKHLNAPSPSEALSYEISQAQNPRLTIFSSSDPILYGQSLTIHGTLAKGASQPVTLLARAHGGTFVPVAKTTTDASGNYAFTAQMPLKNTSYQVSGGGTNSAILFEGVKYLLSPVAVSQSTVQAGQPFMVSGTVAPGHAGHVVYLQRRNAGGVGFHVVALGTVSSGSTYSIAAVSFDPGSKELRIKIPGDPENQGTASPPFTIQVTPAPPESLLPRSMRLPGNGQL